MSLNLSQKLRDRVTSCIFMLKTLWQLLKKMAVIDVCHRYDQNLKLGTHTKELYSVWKERRKSCSKNGQLPTECIVQLFYHLDIFPSCSQVHEMIYCAAQSAQRSASDGITFGEFCVFASELKHNRQKGPFVPESKLPENHQGSIKKTRRTVSNSSSNYEVFLGGSCNPTTWRKDIAIPILKDMDITYYNPQVSHWGPELIELENQAKQNADVLFFVIDNQTRSIASIIEASHLAGSRRKLILVINSFHGPGDKVLGECMSEREFEDLSVGRAHLQDLVERQNIPVFKSLETALKCTGKVVKEGMSVQDLTTNDGANPVKMNNVRPGEKIVKLREIFQSLDTDDVGLISLSDVSLGIRILTKKNLSMEDMSEIYKCFNQEYKEILSQSISEISYLKKKLIDFESFCCIVAEYKHQLEESDEADRNILKNLSVALMNSAIRPFSRLFAWALPKRTIHQASSQKPATYSQGFRNDGKNIFLGGSHGESQWREEIAIPIFKKHGITYYNPMVKSWVDRLIPIQLAAVEKSQVLLFVITNQTRSLGSMTVAAHYAGVGCNMVLCIQYLVENTVIGEEKLSKQAVKDYNRGRVYLSDLANREGIPVFDDIQDAVDCAVKKVQDLS